MRFRKLQSLLLAVTMGVAAVIISMGLLEVSPALALERAETKPMGLDLAAQPPSDEPFLYIVVFTDPASIQITDLAGNVIGDGKHGGKIRCNRNNCSQKTNLTFGIPLTDPAFYEYKYTTRLAFDLEEEIAVVAGTGTISSRRQKERFSFTATFQNNRDGTIWVRYEASRPDASFIVPNAPGRFEIRTR